MDRPNYFDLLGIDPDASPKDIQKAITDRNNLWSRPHPTRGAEFEQHRQRLPHIRQVMGDQALLRQEADNCRSRRQGATADLRTAAEKDLKLFATEGFLKASEFDQVSNLPQYRAKLSREDFLGIAGNLNIRILPDPTVELVEPPKPRLEPTAAQRIQDDLDLLGKSSLYEFLGLSSTSPLKVLTDKASETLEGYRRTQSITPQLTVTGRLAGDCLTLFSTLEQKSRYDESLRLVPLDEMLRQANSLGQIRGQITPEIMDRLLGQAKEKGINEGEARRAIARLASQRGWPIQQDYRMVVPDPLPPPPPRPRGWASSRVKLVTAASVASILGAITIATVGVATALPPLPIPVPVQVIQSLDCGGPVPRLVAVNETVSCSVDLAGGTADSYAWKSDGGSPTQSSNPNFLTSYSLPGPRQIELEVCSQRSCSSKSLAVIVGKPAESPNVQSLGCAPVNVKVLQAITCNPSLAGGKPDSYTWTSVGGNPAQSNNSTFSTTYSSAGSGQIEFEICNQSACASQSQSVTITEGQSERPVVQWLGCAPASVKVFQDITCNPSLAGGKPDSYTWTSVGGSPAHSNNSTFSTSYGVAGQSQIELNVCNQSGCTAQSLPVMVDIPVELPILQSLNCLPTQVEVNQAVVCSPMLGGGISTSYTWTSDGGSSAQSNNSTFSTFYWAAGQRQIELRVCNQSGCDTEFQLIDVQAIKSTADEICLDRLDGPTRISTARSIKGCKELLEAFDYQGVGWLVDPLPENCRTAPCFRSGEANSLVSAILIAEIESATRESGRKLSFYVRVGSEECCGVLTHYLYKNDMDDRSKITKAQDWTLVNVDLMPAIYQRYFWEYVGVAADPNRYSYKHTVWIDDIHWDP